MAHHDLNPRNLLGVALILALFLALQLPGLSAPLLEGAAGKQTHSAMMARNLQQGRGTFLRPMVDDMGRPGYFVKEMPIVPALAGALGGTDSASLDVAGRALGLLAWVFAIAIFATITLRTRGGFVALVGASWMAFAPLAIVYSRAFQNDAAAVAAALATFAAMAAWRRQPSLGRSLAVAAGVVLALVLKPHAALWLAPAGAVFAFSRAEGERPARPATRSFILLGTLAGLLASSWYGHAAAVHHEFPVPGTTVPDGWIDFWLLLEPDFWLELGRQVVEMVFTPVGALVAGFGLIAQRRSFSLVERALLAWGAGVLLQDLVFATRFFDHTARGTEYYQLPLLVPAALLVATGFEEIARRLAARSAPLRVAALTATGVLLLVSSTMMVREATTVPGYYARILPDCERVRASTSADGEFLVFADRTGTILYYCERRGRVFVLGKPLSAPPSRVRKRAPQAMLNEALREATYVYFPFPELVVGGTMIDYFDQTWERVEDGEDALALFQRKGS